MQNINFESNHGDFCTRPSNMVMLSLWTSTHSVYLSSPKKSLNRRVLVFKCNLQLISTLSQIGRFFNLKKAHDTLHLIASWLQFPKIDFRLFCVLSFCLSVGALPLTERDLSMSKCVDNLMGGRVSLFWSLELSTKILPATLGGSFWESKNYFLSKRRAGHICLGLDMTEKQNILLCSKGKLSLFFF